MLQRIRKCFNIKSAQLKNKVEVDEAFIGGKSKNAQGGKGKMVAFGMIERKGKLVAKVVKDRKRKTLEPEIFKHIDKGASVMTDELLSYKALYQTFDHYSVNHSAKEYVNGAIHTNTIEGFWSIFKRGLLGIYHLVPKKHLQKYLDEFVFRYNTKDYTEQERFNYFFANMQNRLRYKELIT